MFENKTYVITSAEEVEEARANKDKAVSEFRNKYRNYLLTCLCDSGFANVKVRAKKENIIGFIEVDSNSGSSYCPYKLHFYPIKKNGEKSLKHTYIVGLLTSYGEDLTGKLLSLFEIVGD